MAKKGILSLGEGELRNSANTLVASSLVPCPLVFCGLSLNLSGSCACPSLPTLCLSKSFPRGKTRKPAPSFKKLQDLVDIQLAHQLALRHSHGLHQIHTGARHPVEHYGAAHELVPLQVARTSIVQIVEELVKLISGEVARAVVHEVAELLPGHKAILILIRQAENVQALLLFPHLCQPREDRLSHLSWHDRPADLNEFRGTLGPG